MCDRGVQERLARAGQLDHAEHGREVLGALHGRGVLTLVELDEETVGQHQGIRVVLSRLLHA